MTETQGIREEHWQKFETKMRDHVIRESRQSYGWPCTIFEELINELGVKEAAYRLLMKYPPRPGVLSGPWREHRLDLTLEYWVNNDRFRWMFTPDEIESARWRLQNAAAF
jgi:hypothetical protein